MQVILDELLKNGKISPEEYKNYSGKMGAPAPVAPAMAAPMGGLQRPKSMGQGDNYFPDIQNREVETALKQRGDGFTGIQNPAIPAPNAAAGGIKPDSKVVPNPMQSNRSMTRSPGIGMDGQRLSAKEMGEMLGQRMDYKSGINKNDIKEKGSKSSKSAKELARNEMSKQKQKPKMVASKKK